MLTPDTLLQNRYLILRLIDQGGMGAVYQAKDQRLGIIVALKETFFTDITLSKAFEREARLLANLRHPALPRVIDHFIEPQGQFLVMEFIPGDNLAKLLEQQSKSFSPGEVLRWADQLLDTLAYLHRQNPPIIHRDVKPQNLKLIDQDQVILLDFGLAKGTPLHVSKVTSSGSIFGYTPSYAPLEQIQGSGTEPRSDLYSLGATLYHLLTANKPVDALARATAVLNNRPDPLVPPKGINPMIPEHVEVVILQAMSLNSDRRPSSAKEMRQALLDTPNPVSVFPVIKEKRTGVVPDNVENAINKRYIPTGQVRSGEADEIYEAHDLKTGRKVRIKHLRTASDRRFLAYALGGLARLKHQNILGLIDYDARSPSPFIVSEFIAGPSLADYLQIHKPLAPPVAVALACQLFSALSSAQEQSILHSHLTPEKIVLEFTGTELIPKINGFGIAAINAFDEQGQAAHGHSQENLIQYRAPEQLQGLQPDENSDIYALGVIFWEMLTGKKPFKGELMDVIFEKERLINGLEINPIDLNISEDLCQLIRQCTLREPKRRLRARAAEAILAKIGLPIDPPAVLAPVNMSFDCEPVIGNLPGWFDSFGYVDNVSTSYNFDVINGGSTGRGACVRMISGQIEEGDFGSLMQRCPGWHLAGGRVRLEGDLRAESVSEWCGLWLRADAGGQALFFGNMYDKRINGSTHWRRYRIEAEIPYGTEWINYGVVLSGEGTVWVDNVNLYVEKGDGQWLEWKLWSEAGYEAAT